MSLVTMKSILLNAQKEKYGVIAANLLTFEMIRGGIKAAEANHSPLILQLAPVQFNTAPLEFIGPLMVAMAKAATVPVAVHLDHGFDQKEVELAISLGFTSVMVDASRFSFEENVNITKKVVEYAKKYNVTVESELGYMGGEEDVDGLAKGYILTSVHDAKLFVEKTGCDCLAVAIGNSHGLRKVQPKLDFVRLEEINNSVSAPLVLHGGSGTSDDDFRHCIRNGITKVNLASIIHKNYLEAMQTANGNYVESIGKLEKAVYDTLDHYINVFGSNNRS